MLTIHFINVWDGDAILFERRTGRRVFRMLVDTGNDQIPRISGLRRVTALEYLQKHGIRELDLVVITHLHVDHFSDLEEIARHIRIRKLYSPYIPENYITGEDAVPVSNVNGDDVSSGSGDGILADKDSAAPGHASSDWSAGAYAAGGGNAVRTRRFSGDPMVDKSLDGLYKCLDQWVRCIRILSREQDCVLRQTADGAAGLELLPGLAGDLILTDSAKTQAQNAVYDRILRGEEVSFDDMYWASKYRNPGSMRMRLSYCGRQIVMGADCFGALWERDAVPCDILKVPHHGDRKALTETLTAGLHPSYAVISCGSEYIMRKDRPSADTISLLKRYGAQVYYTDAFAPAGEEPVIHEAVVMEIREDGTIHVSD